MKKRKRALVFGATGYTGREVVAVLSEKYRDQVETVAHIRPDSGRLEAWREAFESQGARVITTVWEKAPMVERLREEQPDYLFCLIGTTKKRDKKTDEDASYETIDFGLTKLLVDACLDAQVTPRFIYLSAMGVSEKSLSAYYQARWKAEEAVRTSGLCYLLARPGMITGPDREESRPMERAAGVVGDAVAGLLKGIGAKKMARKIESITGRELATALVYFGLQEGDEVVEVEALQKVSERVE